MLAWMIAHTADIVILLIVGAALVAIVRGMRKGRIRACDCNCGCETCGPECPLAHFSLSAEDMEKLQALHSGGGEA